MNKDQVAGKSDQVTGKVKQKVGEAVGNDDMANRGVAEQVKGAARETWGNVKEAAHQDTKESADRTRDNISHNTQDVKNRISDKIDTAKERHHEENESRRSA